MPHSRKVRDRWLSLHRQIDADSTDPLTRNCLLDLRQIACDGEQGRRFHALVHLLGRGGYRLWMVPNLQFLQSAHKTYKFNAISTIRPLAEDRLPDRESLFDLCLTDRNADHPYSDRTLRLVTNVTRPLRDGDLPVPYSFFPSVWDNREDDRFEHYRDTPRVWRLFFGGHCSEHAYKDIAYVRFSPVNRYRVVQQTRSYFRDRMTEISNEEQLNHHSAIRDETFVMIDNGSYRTDPSRWLGLLAQSDFFLAAPGGDYPLSHNAIESIAVGTIPVLEYGSILTPALQDGVNCIAYHGAEGLDEALRRVESMSAERIATMRQNVIEYYEQHLSPSSFCQSLQRHDIQRVHLFPYLTPLAKQLDDCNQRAA